MTCYLNYSVLDKAPRDWENSELHTTGCAVTAGPTYTFVDIIRGKNHNFMGVDPVTAFAQGDPNADWETRFNINIGIYWYKPGGDSPQDRAIAAVNRPRGILPMDPADLE